MIVVIVGEEIKERQKERALHIGERAATLVDDSVVDFSSLEAYAYPSLFVSEAPVVHAKFLLEDIKTFPGVLLETLSTSPTLFVLEELTLSAPKKKELQKYGAVIHEQKKEKIKKSASTIFEVTKALTLPAKKDRWLSYIKAEKEHAPEALVGILYWKLRELIAGATGEKKKGFQAMYRTLMDAHKHAWQNGYPLSLAIEKVILEQ